jgi:hypothetical protein
MEAKPNGDVTPAVNESDGGERWAEQEVSTVGLGDLETAAGGAEEDREVDPPEPCKVGGRRVDNLEGLRLLERSAGAREEEEVSEAREPKLLRLRARCSWEGGGTRGSAETVGRRRFEEERKWGTGSPRREAAIWALGFWRKEIRRIKSDPMKPESGIERRKLTFSRSVSAVLFPLLPIPGRCFSIPFPPPTPPPNKLFQNPPKIPPPDEEGESNFSFFPPLLACCVRELKPAAVASSWRPPPPPFGEGCLSFSFAEPRLPKKDFLFLSFWVEGRGGERSFCCCCADGEGAKLMPYVGLRCVPAGDEARGGTYERPEADWIGEEDAIVWALSSEARSTSSEERMRIGLRVASSVGSRRGEVGGEGGGERGRAIWKGKGEGGSAISDGNGERGRAIWEGVGESGSGIVYGE